MSQPKIDIYPQASPTPHHTWRCDIHEGPGHHGVGDSPQKALLEAAYAWCNYEEENGETDETTI